MKLSLRKLQDLVDMKPNDVQASQEGSGVDPDAETDDEAIPIQCNKTKVSIVDQDFEDFRLDCILNFYPEWAHPVVKEYFKTKYN